MSKYELEQGEFEVNDEMIAEYVDRIKRWGHKESLTDDELGPLLIILGNKICDEQGIGDVAIEERNLN